MFLVQVSIVVQASGDQKLPLQVTTIRLEQASSYQVERVYAGTIESSRESQLGFQYPGAIESIHVDEGDIVEKGDTLVKLESSELMARQDLALADLASSRASLLVARSQWELTLATMKRHQELVKDGHTSGQRLDEVRFDQKMKSAALQVARTHQQQAEANLQLIQIQIDKTELKAPFNGVIQQRLMDEGTIVSAGQPVLHLMEYGNPEARIGIPMDMVEHIKPGDHYEFKVGSRTFPGKFRRMLPKIEKKTGTVTAIFSLDAEALFAGSLTELVMSVDVEADGFWIPISALSESQRGLWSVLVVSEADTVELRLVEIVHRGDNRVFVRGTLFNGDMLVEGGTSRVVPGQEVSLAHSP
jgi:RND family efflux transporter MFP subunit